MFGNPFQMSFQLPPHFRPNSFKKKTQFLQMTSSTFSIVFKLIQSIAYILTASIINNNANDAKIQCQRAALLSIIIDPLDCLS